MRFPPVLRWSKLPPNKPGATHVERSVLPRNADFRRRAALGALCCTLLAPAPAPSTAAAGPAPSGRADRNPLNDFVVAPPDPIPDCEDQLRGAGVKFERASLPVRAGRRSGPTCGTEQAVVYQGGPEKIRYGSSPILSCGMALALAEFETVLNTEAKRELGQPVVRISHLGTYNCRRMARYPDWVSEHAYANAIDIESFTLKSGKKLTVERAFAKTERDLARPPGLFLERLSHRLFEEDVFSTVITPAFDALHKNHFHLDLARYRVDGTRRDR